MNLSDIWFCDSIFFNKVQEKHVSRIISALLAQLLEVAVNFANRLNPFLKSSKVSPIRETQVPHQGVLAAYGPGAHPSPRERYDILSISENLT